MENDSGKQEKKSKKDERRRVKHAQTQKDKENKNTMIENVYTEQ